MPMSTRFSIILLVLTLVVVCIRSFLVHRKPTITISWNSLRTVTVISASTSSDKTTDSTPKKTRLLSLLRSKTKTKSVTNVSSNDINSINVNSKLDYDGNNKKNTVDTVKGTKTKTNEMNTKKTTSTVAKEKVLKSTLANSSDRSVSSNTLLDSSTDDSLSQRSGQYVDKEGGVFSFATLSNKRDKDPFDSLSKFGEIISSSNGSSSSSSSSAGSIGTKSKPAGVELVSFSVLSDFQDGDDLFAGVDGHITYGDEIEVANSKNAVELVGFDLEDELDSFFNEGAKFLEEAKPFKGPNIDNSNGHDTEGIQELLDRRQQARFNKDYDAADAARDELRMLYNVEIYDRRGVWQAKDGRSGPLKRGVAVGYDDRITPAAPVDCELTEKEVQQLVERRTMLRRSRKFREADEIRDKLAAAGVELMDKSNEWRSIDGKYAGLQSFDMKY